MIRDDGFVDINLDSKSYASGGKIMFLAGDLLFLLFARGDCCEPRNLSHIDFNSMPGCVGLLSNALPAIMMANILIPENILKQIHKMEVTIL